jgi:Rnl2 family RNA ligase
MTPDLPALLRWQRSSLPPLATPLDLVGALHAGLVPRVPLPYLLVAVRFRRLPPGEQRRLACRAFGPTRLRNPMEIPKYISLVTLKQVPEILSVKRVVATEKLHGANFRIHFPAGMTSLDEVRFGSREQVFDPATDGFYGGRPVRWFRDNPTLLAKMAETFTSRGLHDVTVYGEVCGSGIQKGVRYSPDGEVFFRAFDIRVGENFVTYEFFVNLCDDAGLARVPEVWSGEPSKEAFDALLERASDEGLKNGVEGPNLAEGVVIRSNPLLRTVFGTYLIIKHKAKAFREVTPPAEKKVATANPADDFAATFVNEGRLLNAVGRLRDAGTKLGSDMRDMPVVTEAVMVDLKKEAGPELQALEASGATERSIRGAVTRAVGAAYRTLLTKGLVERHPHVGT